MLILAFLSVRWRFLQFIAIRWSAWGAIAIVITYRNRSEGAHHEHR